MDATNLSRDNIYSGGVSLEPTSIHPPIHLNTCCFDIVGSEQQTTWEKKKHRESHSRLSRSSADDLDDIRPRGDIWEVWLPLLQLLRQPVRGNQEKNSPNMRFCTKCPHHTSLILIQLEGVIHHDSLYILTCEAALWLIVTPTLWKAATSTIQTWLCLCVLQLTGSYYSSCFFLTRTWATCTQKAKTVQQWFQFISVCNKNQLTEHLRTSDRSSSQLTFNFLFWDLDKLCPAVFVATKTNILSQTIMFSKGHCSFWESLEIELLSHLVMRTCWSFYLCLLLFLLQNTYDGRTGGGLTCWQGTENQLFFTGIVRLHSLSSYITLWRIIRCFPRR